MGRNKRVEITEKDLLCFNFLYKHNYANFKSFSIIYKGKTDTIYRRLKKLKEYGYIKAYKIQNMETIYAFWRELVRDLKERYYEILYDKGCKKQDKIARNTNINHHLKICEIGAELTVRGINYDIDINLHKVYPKWRLIPDILINGKIAFELELENKSTIEYREKLTRLQNTKEIEKLVYIKKGSKEGLRKKIEKAKHIKLEKGTLDERIIITETMEKISYVDLNDFIGNIDKFLK